MSSPTLRPPPLPLSCSESVCKEKCWRRVHGSSPFSVTLPRVCQRTHWPNHKSLCRPNTENVGLPFLVSVPESRLCYGRLTQLLEGYSRYARHTWGIRWLLMLASSKSCGKMCRFVKSSLLFTCASNYFSTKLSWPICCLLCRVGLSLRPKICILIESWRCF